MSTRRSAAVLMPVALLFCLAAFAQDATRQPRGEREDQTRGDQTRGDQARTGQRPRAGASGGGSGITLPGPDGRDVLEVNKEAPRQIRAGEEFRYQITVRNVSDSPVNGVVIVEEHDGLQIRNAQGQDRQGQGGRQQNQDQQQQQRQQQDQQNQAQDDQQRQQQEQQRRQQEQQQQQVQQQQQQGQQQVQQEGNTIRYRIGELQAGESKTLSVAAVAEQAGQAQSCLSVEYNPTLCTTFEVVQPDFRLTSRLRFSRDLETEANVEGVYRCDNLFLDVAVTSTGDAETPPAQVTVDLPQGLTAVQGGRQGQGGRNQGQQNQNQQAQGGQRQVQLDLGPIRPGQTVRREIPVKLDPQQAGDQIQLTSRAQAGELQAQVQLPGVKVLEPQLVLNVQAPQGEQFIDRPVEMRVSVENPSQAPVLDARVKVEQPEGVRRFTVQGANAGRDGMIDVGRLDPGQKREFTVRIEAERPTNAAVVVKADGYCVETITKEARLNLKGVPALLIEVVDKKDPVPVGETTVYEIAVKNQGTDRDTNVQLSATLPEGMEFVNGRGETRVNANGNQVSFGEIPEVAPNDVVSWTIEVKANQAAKARFKVELKSNAIANPITEEEPTTLY